MRIKISNNKQIIKESRGFQEFVPQMIAEETADKLKQHLINYANQTSKSQGDRSKMMGIINITLEDFEKEVKELIKEKFDSFLSKI